MSTPKGLAAVVAMLNNAVANIAQAAQEGLLAGALLIRAEAQKRTPVMTGNLRSSAFVTWSGGIRAAGYGISGTTPKFRNVIKGDNVPTIRMDEFKRVTSASIARCNAAATIKKFTVEIGFSAAYATRVHENERAGKTKGESPSGRVYKPGKLPSGRRSTRIVYAESGEWKFLETAMKENAPRVVELVRKGVKGVLK